MRQKVVAGTIPLGCLSRLRRCAKTDPQRACPPKPRRRWNSILTKGPSDVLDHATSEIASGSNPGLDATKKIPGEGFKHPWPPLIKMVTTVKAKVKKLFNQWANVKR